MYCLRCGNDTKDDQVFCEECLDKMEKYPVKPGTPVKIPSRVNHTVSKKQSRRKMYSPDEQVSRLKVRLRTAYALLGSCVVILGIFVYLYFFS